MMYQKKQEKLLFQYQIQCYFQLRITIFVHKVGSPYPKCQLSRLRKSPELSAPALQLSRSRQSPRVIMTHKLEPNDK